MGEGGDNSASRKQCISDEQQWCFVAFLPSTGKHFERVSFLSLSLVLKSATVSWWWRRRRWGERLLCSFNTVDGRLTQRYSGDGDNNVWLLCCCDSRFTFHHHHLHLHLQLSIHPIHLLFHLHYAQHILNVDGAWWT